MFEVSAFDADTLSEPFRIPCTYCLTKTKKFSYLRSSCSDFECQVVFEPYLMSGFYVTRWNLPQNPFGFQPLSNVSDIEGESRYRYFQIQEFQFEAYLMHYLSTAPGRLKRFGLVTVKSIGTHWNFTEPGSGLCMGSMSVSLITHFSTCTRGIHVE